jgi:hypothetical protein
MAEALLSRETLDAEQVRRICAGLPIDEPPAATSSDPTQSAPQRESKPSKERTTPGIVPQRPLTQE